MEEGLSAVARLLAPVQPYCSLISAHDVGNREFLDPVHDSVARERRRAALSLSSTCARFRCLPA